ncbi:MAG TPA: hypothetical protein PK156_27060, partial [Polyangium sp.]|nr:hypothetical protein [Polyangium sp.]
GEALALAEEGLSLYAKMEACSQFFRGAFLRLTHAEILESLGRHDEAGAAIRNARECIRVNAAKIDDLVMRTKFLENVPENRRTLELAQAWCGAE